MAGTDEPEVKDIDTVYVQPAGDDAEDVDTEDTDQESSPENEGNDESEEDSDKPDQLVQNTVPANDKKESEDDGLQNVENETPRERALRLEVTNLKRAARKERTDEILGGNIAPAAERKELPPEKKSVLDKYKPEEVASLREVLPVLAEEMGYVRKDELDGSSYAEKSQEILDGFLDKHPEYLPENDKDGTLWGAFKTEFGIYKQPTNPKDFTKIFNRTHEKVFGIKPAGALSKVNAQREKTQVASHAGASSRPSTAAAQRNGAASAQAFRTDMLKGFTDEEKVEMFGE